MKKRTVKLVSVAGKTPEALLTRTAAERERCTASGERVLVVYGSSAATIYSEAPAEALPLMPATSKGTRR